MYVVLCKKINDISARFYTKINKLKLKLIDIIILGIILLLDSTKNIPKEKGSKNIVGTP